MPTRLILPLVVLVSGAAGFFLYLAVNPQPGPPPDAIVAHNGSVESGFDELSDLTLPDIVLPDLDGKPRSLREWSGGPILVNFWATWCPPCRDEIPLLIALAGRYRDAGLTVIGVALDEAAVTADYAAGMGIPYPVLIGEENGIEAANALGVDVVALPVSVLVGRDGRILDHHYGELHEDEATAWLAPALASQ